MNHDDFQAVKRVKPTAINGARLGSPGEAYVGDAWIGKEDGKWYFRPNGSRPTHFDSTLEAAIGRLDDFKRRNK